MKLLLLSDPTSTHTKKWVHALSEKDIEIAVFGLGTYSDELYTASKGVKLFSGGNGVKTSWIGKLSYLNTRAALKRVYLEFKPDIVHAHYATSYGMLGAILKHSPYIISVWGSDIYDFPKRSFIHKIILKRNLAKADLILSTGFNMAKEANKFTNKSIKITPFGIDTTLFVPLITKEEDKIVVGTVKGLEDVYGINYLLESFKLVVNNNPDIKLELVIAGTGSKEEELKDLATQLLLKDKVRFIGRVDHCSVPEVLNQFDIYVALSNSESFGVAILEASACEIPVVVSDADGFKEVVKDEVTGLIVPRRNPEQAAGAIQNLIDNKLLRKQLGINGRKHVLENYDWNNNVKGMLSIYDQLT